MTSNISKEAIAETLEMADVGELIGGQYNTLAQQVRELDALVEWVLVVAEEIANTKIADIGEIERLNYSIRDKIKQARGE